MNKINPLHIAALLLVLLAFFMLKLSGVKTELAETKKLYTQTRTVAQDLAGLKKAYANKQNTQRSINRILKQPSLRSVNIEKKSTRKGLVLSAAKMDRIALNSFFSKILNGTFMIKGVQIKKIDENYASMRLEIQW